MDPKLFLVETAKKYVGVKETAPNRGPEVDQFQIAVLGKATGIPWCACFVWFCIKEVEKALSIQSPLHCSAAALDIWGRSPLSQRLTSPAPGAIAIWQFGKTWEGHCGIVTSTGVTLNTMNTVEGNTSDGEGVVREGDGVYARVRHSTPVPGAMKLLGFLSAF